MEKAKFEDLLQISSNHSSYLTSNGFLYVWGCNQYGQLGIGSGDDHFEPRMTNNRYSPTLLRFPRKEKVSFVTFGFCHALCITENNLCYVWGWNEYGQLGLGDRTNRSKPTLLTLPNAEKASFITCGARFTVCLTQKNSCYIWGWNNDGQLGLDDENNRSISIPTLLSFPNNERISFVACGYNHTICLAENSLCYVWGDNSNGELGIGDTTNRSRPTLLSLPNNERISFIACGFNHTICLTENNLGYVWGNNNYGQLGLGKEPYLKQSLHPILLSLPNNERIFFIACGANHTMCLTEKNLGYVWGNNRHGQLGLGHKNNIFVPSFFTLPNNERISFIGCGFTHTMCLTETNLCYVWGNNNYGQLGLGHKAECLVPTLLKLPKPKVKLLQKFKNSLKK